MSGGPCNLPGRQPARGSKVMRKFCGKEGEGLWVDEAKIIMSTCRA